MTIQLSESQKQAIKLALDFSISKDKFFNIVGDAYTGKSTLVPYLAKELESFLKVYNSIVGGETSITVVVPNHRLKIEHIRQCSGMEVTPFPCSTGVYAFKPTIFIIDNPYDSKQPYLNSYNKMISAENDKFIILSRTPKSIDKSYRLDPIIKPVKPVKLNREDFTAKLKEDIIKDSSNTAYVTELDSGNVIDSSMDFLDKSKIAPNTVLKDYSGMHYIFENYVDSEFDGKPCKAYVFTDGSADASYHKYSLDISTLPYGIEEYYTKTSGVGHLYVDNILRTKDIIGLKFKNVYLHSEGSYNTPIHLEKILGSALENLYILEE